MKLLRGIYAGQDDPIVGIELSERTIGRAPVIWIGKSNDGRLHDLRAQICQQRAQLSGLFRRPRYENRPSAERFHCWVPEKTLRAVSPSSRPNSSASLIEPSDDILIILEPSGAAIMPRSRRFPAPSATA